jgi:RNA polymerase sigma-70 factor (ECF subfamily)
MAGLQDTDAAEVTQNVFIIVSRALPKLRRDRETDTFRGWLRRVTQSQIAQHFRVAEKFIGKTPGGSEHCLWLAGLAAEQSGAHKSQAQDKPPTNEELAVQRVRARCAPQSWEIFCRLTIAEEATADIAAELGVTENQIYVIKHRLTRRIRQELSAVQAEMQTAGSAQLAALTSHPPRFKNSTTEDLA